MKVTIATVGKLTDVEVTLDSGFTATFEQCEFGRWNSDAPEKIKAWALEQATIAEARAADPVIAKRRKAEEDARQAEADAKAAKQDAHDQASAEVDTLLERLRYGARLVDQLEKAAAKALEASAERVIDFSAKVGK